ncbi:MAG: nucleotidyltransferase domain-containing protein [Ignavibacteriae bacterium]|nr:nucleotidyltransferase domain-containing protein [Ignavibacteriota bacterium]NOG97452.1 nucleotidyltransferase domain-containing protein [Ignavibacteriota bacterium]
MDKDKIIEIVKRYIGAIGSKYKIEKVFLFGSYAKGTNTADSDIDLAIIFNSVDDIIDMQIELMKMRTEDDLLIEPHPFRLTDFKISNPMVSEILKNGIEFNKYAAEAELH